MENFRKKFCYHSRQIALSTYHPYECKMVDFLTASGMSIICFMSYRTIAQKPLEFFLENRDKCTGHDEVAGSKNSNVIITNIYCLRGIHFNSHYTVKVSRCLYLCMHDLILLTKNHRQAKLLRNATQCKKRTQKQVVTTLLFQVTKYLSDDYRNIYNLVTHHSERKMNDLFHRVTIA